eukprot:TRINITY_DN4226_c0_g1_i1.p1 TRINITY_DN4226_c0_g1~~TRINITY_DN4226_c0_g1_i1.p1  ORF type:complete len:387 (-),score=60.51 TRINITY_DN4226_c0_g1_i1:166-1326(-)
MDSSFILCFLFLKFVCAIGEEKLDANGYLMYCPCMGRFGNQAEHFLGALEFARRLDRTLVIPPWIEYEHSNRRTLMVPFQTYFNVSKVNEYHRAVSMEYFFDNLAQRVWPIGKRTSFCYTARRGPQSNSCNAKDGNPFGPFWNNFDVEFDDSEMYGPLPLDVHHQAAEEKWQDKYPASRYPALAFTGAPATFPAQKENIHLQKYFVYNEVWMQKAKNWIKANLPKGPFVGIHLRNGIDWERACEHVDSTNQLFSSPQCLGYRNEGGELTKELCLPSETTIIKHIKKAVKKVSAVAVFVASDNNFMLETLASNLKTTGVVVRRLDQGDQPHLDLAILSQSNFFIGNCVSSFTAFVKRLRDVDGLPSGFWAYPLSEPKQKSKKKRDEF